MGVGEEVGPEQPICLIHAADRNARARAAEAVRAAVRIVTGERIASPVTIHERIAVE
jgi:thymidine phosphorylase